jgi:tetratricopeptide (TPR) repeat protein
LSAAPLSGPAPCCHRWASLLAILGRCFLSPGEALGGLSLLAGNADEAISYYRRALEIQPDCGLAARNLREAQRLKGP